MTSSSQYPLLTPFIASFSDNDQLMRRLLVKQTTSEDGCNFSARLACHIALLHSRGQAWQCCVQANLRQAGSDRHSFVLARHFPVLPRRVPVAHIATCQVEDDGLDLVGLEGDLVKATEHRDRVVSAAETDILTEIVSGLP